MVTVAQATTVLSPGDAVRTHLLVGCSEQSGSVGQRYKARSPPGGYIYPSDFTFAQMHA